MQARGCSLVRRRQRPHCGAPCLQRNIPTSSLDWQIRGQPSAPHRRTGLRTGTSSSSSNKLESSARRHLNQSASEAAAGHRSWEHIFAAHLAEDALHRLDVPLQFQRHAFQNKGHTEVIERVREYAELLTCADLSANAASIPARKSAAAA